MDGTKHIKHFFFKKNISEKASVPRLLSNLLICTLTLYFQCCQAMSTIESAISYGSRALVVLMDRVLRDSRSPYGTRRDPRDLADLSHKCAPSDLKLFFPDFAAFRE